MDFWFKKYITALPVALLIWGCASTLEDSLHKGGDTDVTQQALKQTRGSEPIYPRLAMRGVEPVVKLRWTSPYNGSFVVKFGKSEDELEIIGQGVQSKELTIPFRLQRNNRYFWQVIPEVAAMSTASSHPSPLINTVIKGDPEPFFSHPAWSFTTEKFSQSPMYQIATE